MSRWISRIFVDSNHVDHIANSFKSDFKAEFRHNRRVFVLAMRFGLALVVLAGCAKSEPRATATTPLLDPVIGTRGVEDGVLTPVDGIDDDDTRYIGCDLKFAGVPANSEIELVWLFKPVAFSDSPTVIHRAVYRVQDGDRAPKRAWVERVVDPTTGKNALGSYECLWTLAARGASARLLVRIPSASI